MKHINKIIVLLLVVASFTACEDDFLSPDPTGVITDSNFYSSDEEIESAIINIYDGLQGVNSTTTTDLHSVQYEFYITEMRSDNTQTKSSEGEPAQFETFEVETTNGIIDNYYASMYNIIYRANTVLGYLDNATEASAGSFEGECKFLRAYAYFNLVRLYGDVPLVTEVISPEDTETAYTRIATATVYDQIEADLEVAVANLDNTYKSRASKAAAQAMLAKVYLTQGENYDLAQGLCEDVMASGFSLYSNLYDVFYDELNSEIIFAIGYVPSLSDDSQNFSSEWLNAVGRTSGVNYVTEEAVAAFGEYGGNRGLDVSYRVDPYQTTMYQVTKYLPNGETGGTDGKTFEIDATLAGNDWVVSRYADVLLMHVEAILAGGTETTSADARGSFQEVRDRAGLTETVSIVTKDDLLNERRVELAFENHRLFDLIRFGVAQEVLSEFSSANGYGFSSTDLLLPIPVREINLSNGLLTQNPGY